MNRRQRIIVSVTGIFIVLLILIGLTYAYFLTRITGNGNPTSISVTTANLELVYGDGTTSILTSETPLMPSTTPIGTKDFTVTNNGDDSEYVVVFEDVTVKYAENTVIDGEEVAKDTPTTFESNDFVYTLTCTVKDKNGNTLSDKSCDGVENETFPMDGGIVLGNNIEKDDVHNYVLTLYYLDNGLDQSADMNKTLNGKVNIKDIKSINPYSENTESLAYNIINNSILNKNGTELVATPPSKVGVEGIIVTETSEVELIKSDIRSGIIYESLEDSDNYGPTGSNYVSTCSEDLKGKWVFATDNDYSSYGPIAGCDEEYFVFSKPILDKEKVLSVTPDDFGTSYYYRGDVKDNYVNFAGMCWRIVRIEGDGSIKLNLEDQTTTCEKSISPNSVIGMGNIGLVSLKSNSYGETLYKINYLEPQSNPEQSMVKAFYDFQNTLTTKISTIYEGKSITNMLRSGNWCFQDTPYTSSGELITDLDAVYANNTTIYFDAFFRLGQEPINPSLKCNGTIMNEFKNVTVTNVITTQTNMYVGALTADEIAFAGRVFEKGGIPDIYLSKIAGTLFSPLQIMPSDYSGFLITSGLSGGSNIFDLENKSNFVPVIKLNNGTIISTGTGIKTDPYVIE